MRELGENEKLGPFVEAEVRAVFSVVTTYVRRSLGCVEITGTIECCSPSSQLVYGLPVIQKSFVSTTPPPHPVIELRVTFGYETS